MEMVRACGIDMGNAGARCGWENWEGAGASKGGGLAGFVVTVEQKEMFT